MKPTTYLRRAVAVALCAALLCGCDVAGAPAQPSAAPQPTDAPAVSPGAETAYPAPPIDSSYPAPLEPSSYPAPPSTP